MFMSDAKTLHLRTLAEIDNDIARSKAEFEDLLKDAQAIFIRFEKAVRRDTAKQIQTGIKRGM